MTEAKAGRPLGLKPKSPMGGKGHQLSANISKSVWDALQLEAAETGRSISQVTERRLLESLNGQAEFLDRFGGDLQIAAGLERLVKLKAAVDQAFSEPPDRYYATRAGWEALIPHLLTPSDLSDLIPRAKAGTRVWETCLDLIYALDDAGSSDPIYQRANQSFTGPSRGLLLGSKTFDKLAIALDGRQHASQLDAVAALDELRAVAEQHVQAVGIGVRAALDEAIRAGHEWVEADDAWAARHREAVEFGRLAALGSVEGSPRHD